MIYRQISWKLLLMAPIAACLLGGCAAGTAADPILRDQTRIGVVEFRQCRPDLSLKEIGLSDIENRNEAQLCNRKGMPLIFATELKNRLQERLKREVQLITLDVPYNHNIKSQIDIAKAEKVDYLVGGMLGRYIDADAVRRARKKGILPAIATLSPVMEQPVKATVLVADVKVARISDSELLAEMKFEEEGDLSGEAYTNELADRIAVEVFGMH